MIFSTKKMWRNVEDEPSLLDFVESLEAGFDGTTSLTIEFATSYGGYPGHPEQLGLSAEQVQEMTERIIGLIEASTTIQEVNLNLFFSELWKQKDRVERILADHPTLLTFNLQTTCASRRVSDAYTLRRPDEGPIRWCQW